MFYPLIETHLAEQENNENNKKKQLKQAVDYIDLRYDTGLAVGWKEVTNLSSNISLKIQQKSYRADIFPSNELQTKELILNV